MPTSHRSSITLLGISFLGLLFQARAQDVTLTPTGNDLYNTGYNGNAVAMPGQADTHYSLGNSSSYRAVTLASNWFPNSPLSSWITISPTSTAGGTAATYDYHLPLTNIPAGSKVNLAAELSVDDSVSISVNGMTPTFTNLSPTVTAANYSTVNPVLATFVAGSSNYIDFKVFNVNGPTGINVSLTGYYFPKVVTTPVPIVTPSPVAPVIAPAAPTAPVTVVVPAAPVVVPVAPIVVPPVFVPRIAAPPQVMAVVLDSQVLLVSITPVVAAEPLIAVAPVQFNPSGLNSNQTNVLQRINAINAAGLGDVCFTDLTVGLLTQKGNSFSQALDQLSPQQLSVLSTIAFNNAEFETQDLDDYLAHRRMENGDFQSAESGLDVSGLSVKSAGVDPALSSTYDRLRDWNVGAETGAQAPAKGPYVPPIYQPGKWNTFVRGTVILGQDFSNTDVNHTDYTTSSFQVGTDYQISSHWLTGLFFSYDHTDTSLDSLGGSATVDSYSPGLYASYAQGGWYANALGSMARNNYTETRRIGIGGFNESPSAAPNGDQELGNVDGGFDFHVHQWTFGPTLGVQYVHLNINGFTETQGCSSDLSLSNQEAESLRSRLGGHVSYKGNIGEVVLTPFFDANWQHEFLDDSRSITSSFSEITPATFSVATPNLRGDSALVVSGLNIDFAQRMTAFLDYQVRAGDRDFSQAVQLGLKVAF